MLDKYIPWVNNHAHILKSRWVSYGKKYIMYYLNIFNYNGYVNGITRLKLTQKKMLEIPIPPLAKQERIVNRIESLFEKVDMAAGLVNKARGGFKKRRSAILERAFSGELTKKWDENY
ncbi:restriction endonuclease subunit S [Romboutsia weinsteinii]|uniref:restriction endonuclease subunit S n=1 Tax=Romboutsia weinsteinii TaxID=2020949 RepID=UPI001313E497|nr:restriction endonuclease subunit S [Romboutsia weinsteinii]